MLTAKPTKRILKRFISQKYRAFRKLVNVQTEYIYTAANISTFYPYVNLDSISVNVEIRIVTNFTLILNIKNTYSNIHFILYNEFFYLI